MRRVILKILLFLVFLALLGWLLYPTVMDQLARKEYLGMQEAYLGAVRELDTEAIAKMMEDADAFNAEIEEIQPGDVFTAPAARSTIKYRNLLNFRDGMIGQLEIPSIHISLPIVHISTEDRPDTKLVHVEGSSLPGETGNTHTVLAGPRKQKADGFFGDLALTKDQMLEELDRVTPGNQMMILLGNRTFLYEVRNVQTLSPEGLKNWVAERDPEEDRLTLITERDGRRLLVEAVRIPVSSAREALQAVDGARPPADWLTILALGSPVFLVVLLVMMIIERFKRRAYRLPTETRYRKSETDDAEVIAEAEKTAKEQDIGYNKKEKPADRKQKKQKEQKEQQEQQDGEKQEDGTKD